jgi:ribosomal protein L20
MPLKTPFLYQNPIKRCVVCRRPIVRQVKQPLGRTGKYKRVWSKAKYCSHACEMKAYRQRRNAKREII